MRLTACRRPHRLARWCSRASASAARLSGAGRVAVWAASELETCVGIVAALAAGVPAVPVNPKLGSRELHHVVSDATPDLVLTAPGIELPQALLAIPRLEVDGAESGAGAGTGGGHTGGGCAQ